MIDILLLADPRGFALENQFNAAFGNNHHINMEWISHPGGTILKVVSHGLANLAGSRFHGVGHMGSSSEAWKIRVVEKRCPSFNIQHIMKIHLLGFPRRDNPQGCQPRVGQPGWQQIPPSLSKWQESTT